MTAINANPVTFTEIKPKIGSVVHGSKAALLGGDHAAEILEMLERRGVLVFPELHFSDEEQLAFTRTMGPVAPERGGEEVYNISLDKSLNATADYLKGAFCWHFDGYSQPMPVRASLLCSKVLAPEGGNTEFANCYAAYDDLPDHEKAGLEGLRVVHSAWYTLFSYDFEPEQEALESFMRVPDAELPLVWTHQSGRKSLALGSQAHHVIGMDYKESARLLNRLREWATRDEYRYSHEWSVGDMVMWDNTGTLHRATPYPLDCNRLLHRTKLEGMEPVV